MRIHNNYKKERIKQGKPALSGQLRTNTTDNEQRMSCSNRVGTSDHTAIGAVRLTNQRFRFLATRICMDLRVIWYYLNISISWVWSSYWWIARPANDWVLHTSFWSKYEIGGGGGIINERACTTFIFEIVLAWMLNIIIQWPI